MRISALVTALAFGVFAQSAPKFNMTKPSIDRHCRDVSNNYLLTQRQAGGVTYAFCHDLAKAYNEAPKATRASSKDTYYQQCYCCNQPWALAYISCLTDVGKWKHNKYKKETDQAAKDRCTACHEEYTPDFPYLFPTIQYCGA